MHESLQPSMQQQEAADNLVRALDLSPEDDEELLQPEKTVNPILQVRLILPQGFVRRLGHFHIVHFTFRLHNHQ